VSQFKKYMVLAAVLVASLAAVATATASTVTVTGGTAVTGTAGASRLVNHSGSQTLQCTGAGATATLRASTVGTYPVAISTNLTPTFTGCTIGGVVGITVVCGASPLNVTANTVSGNTAGSITAVSCDIRLGTGTTSTCHVQTTTGSSAGGTYGNTLHTLTIDQDHTTVGLTGSLSGCTLKNSTSARFQNSTGGNLVYTISPSVSVNAAP
jgi:hypothetical protein